MKVISIKQFKAPRGSEPLIDDVRPGAPEHGQLVSIKGKLVQFIVPESGQRGGNCINCHFVEKNCGNIACGSGHYAPVKLPTTPYTAPKE